MMSSSFLNHLTLRICLRVSFFFLHLILAGLHHLGELFFDVVLFGANAQRRNGLSGELVIRGVPALRIRASCAH